MATARLTRDYITHGCFSAPTDQRHVYTYGAFVRVSHDLAHILDVSGIQLVCDVTTGETLQEKISITFLVGLETQGDVFDRGMREDMLRDEISEAASDFVSREIGDVDWWPDTVRDLDTL